MNTKAIPTLVELGKMDTKSLLEVYNAHAPKRITRFADHPSGFRRTKELLATLPKTAVSSTPAAEPSLAGSKSARHKVFVAPMSTPTLKKEYHSVLAAFIALGLPVEKHQRFRRQVKLNGKATFAEFIFTATY